MRSTSPVNLTETLSHLWSLSPLPFVAAGLAVALTVVALCFGDRLRRTWGLAVVLAHAAILLVALGGAGVAVVALREPQRCMLPDPPKSCDQLWGRYQDALYPAIAFGATSLVVPLAGCGVLIARAASQRAARRGEEGRGGDAATTSSAEDESRSAGTVTG